MRLKKNGKRCVGMMLLVNGKCSSSSALQESLASGPWNLNTCMSVSEAFENLLDKNYDCLIVESPKLDSDHLFLLDWVSLNRPRVHVIVVTDEYESEPMQSALSRNVKFYLVTPVASEVLQEALLSLAGDENPGEPCSGRT